MMNDKTGKWKRILLLLFLVALLGLFAVIYILPAVTGAFTKTSLVEYGTLRVTDNVTCYFIRRESVNTAKASGAIQYYFEEGELVRKGTKVIDLVPSGGNYIVEDNYIISYFIDGLESYFTPDSMASLNKDQVEALEINGVDTTRETAVSGEPLYKTVENGEWYVAFWVETDNIVKYTKGTNVTLELPEGKVRCTTLDIIDDEGRWLILLESNRFYPDLQKLRKLEIEVITSDHEGLLIANESITTIEGKTGVYVKQINGDFAFIPVSVIASDGFFSLVQSTFFYENTGDDREKISTVEAYDEILNHPERR